VSLPPTFFGLGAVGAPLSPSPFLGFSLARFPSPCRCREERFHEAELLSLQLDRVRSLGRALGSARRAQERAARLEHFDRAKRYRDEAREAEVWLRQTVRDASVSQSENNNRLRKDFAQQKP